MPEGDTVHRTCVVLRRVLFGQVVTEFDIEHPKVTAMARDDEIVGSTVTKVESNGKHLFIHFGTPHEVVLHTHMKMSGQWHVYRPGERWWQPVSEARVVIRTESVVAVCFHPPICELLTASELGLHPIVGALGPDIIRDEFDVDEALRRLRAKQDRDIATALLDQKVISGIGNAFKVDALFLAKTSPWAPVSDLDDAKLREIVEIARTLMRRNRDGGPRRTRFGLDRAESVWVMERAGLPCHVCGTVVEQGWHPGDDVRKSWYCPNCQNVARAEIPRPAPTPKSPRRHAQLR
jgi:endonuclease-8